MKKILTLFVILALTITTVSAYQYSYGQTVQYQPDVRYDDVRDDGKYTSLTDYFEARYGDYLGGKPMPRYIPAPRTIVDPKGQVYYYMPYEAGQRTQKVYYKTHDDPEAEIVRETYEDGYNMGYYDGYMDGEFFQRYGYEGYIDYVESFKLKTDPDRERSSYYVFKGDKKKISVRPSDSTYDRGYRSGVLEGFKDGYYEITYKGKNRRAYEFEALKNAFPGKYEPVSNQPMQFWTPYRTFPNFAPMTYGNIYYGFNTY